MTIKYDEFDLLELFQSEPESITGNIDDGELIYIYKDNTNFQVVFCLDVYQQTITLSLTWNDSVVFTGDFYHVTNLKKEDNSLITYVEGVKRLKVNFYKQLGVEILDSYL
ncbi:hypothetical protein [Bacillus altitudinis]|uniref:hypothetical protein n=1 Tax=Bacillus altitudinis TaxID=293387 RepID=UPI0037CBFC04